MVPPSSTATAHTLRFVSPVLAGVYVSPPSVVLNIPRCELPTYWVRGADGSSATDRRSSLPTKIGGSGTCDVQLAPPSSVRQSSRRPNAYSTLDDPGASTISGTLPPPAPCPAFVIDQVAPPSRLRNTP